MCVKPIRKDLKGMCLKLASRAVGHDLGREESFDSGTPIIVSQEQLESINGSQIRTVLTALPCKRP